MATKSKPQLVWKALKLKVFYILSFLSMRFVPDWALIEHYKRFGVSVGFDLCDRHIGEPVDHWQRLGSLVRFEFELVERGYRSVPMGVFYFLCDDESSIQVPFRTRREPKIYFAQEWQKKIEGEKIFGNFLARVIEQGEAIVEVQEEPEFLFEYEREFTKLIPSSSPV